MDIDAHHMHEVVGIASHEMTAHDFGRLGNRSLELVKKILGLGIERDLDEDRDAAPDSCGINQHHIAVDHPALFEPTDAPQCCRG